MLPNVAFDLEILFLYGWQSTPGSVKPTYLKSHGHEVLNRALRDGDFAAAVRIAQTEFDRHQPDVVVGTLPAFFFNLFRGEHQWSWTPSDSFFGLVLRVWFIWAVWLP